MLVLALDDRPQLLVESFRRYDLAINTCISHETVPNAALLYLQFVLLLYDTSYASHRCTVGNAMCAQHIDQLARLAYNGCAMDQTLAHVLWYTLQLDIQLCLAGNMECGSFVRAYQLHGSRLPPCYAHEGQPARNDMGSNAYATMESYLELDRFISNKLADLSLMALEVRHSTDSFPSNVPMNQLRIIEFRNTLLSTWHEKVQNVLALTPGNTGMSLRTRLKTRLDLSYFKYSTVMLYLNTSMYRGQLSYNSDTRKQEIVWHTRQILSMVSELIDLRVMEQHQLILSIFLAGVASNDNQDKYRSCALLQTLEGRDISSSVTKTRELLQEIFVEQGIRHREGGFAIDVDWISFSEKKVFIGI